MEFKKCERCGCFFVSQDNVCYNCITKDRAEINMLRNYFDINPNIEEIKEIAYKDIDKAICLYLKYQKQKLDKKGIKLHIESEKLLNLLEK